MLWMVLAGLWLVGATELHECRSNDTQSLAALWGDRVLPSQGLELVIGSHQRFFAHDIETGKHRTLHMGSGNTYYGTFPSDEPSKLWTYMRGDPDRMLELDLSHTINAVKRTSRFVTLTDSQFTHEIVRVKSQIFVADTSTGSINILSYPALTLQDRIQVFSRKEHINSISPVLDEHTGDAKQLWATFHNGAHPSFVVLLDLKSKQIVERIDNIGRNAHSFLELSDKERIYLSSAEASLVKINLDTKEKQVLYQSPSHMKPKPKFLKGLAVIDDVAYFGESELQDRKGRETVPCTLVAFSLKTNQVVFTRTNPGSIGLINTISLPNIPHATYRAVTTSNDQIDAGQRAIQSVCSASLEEQVVLESMRTHGFLFGAFPDSIDIVRLPYQFDAQKLLDEVNILASQVGGWTRRPDVNNYFVLLVTKQGIPTDQSNHGPFLPVPHRLDTTPTLRHVMRKLGVVIGRTRLMLIKPGESVIVHVDNTNHMNKRSGQPDANSGYWGRRFRIHIPLATGRDQVHFYVGGRSKVHFELGGAYVFDNSKFHAVENKWDKNRIHLVIDTVGSPRLMKAIMKGQKYPQDTRVPPELNMHVELPAASLQDGFENKLVYENWLDSPVFTPMPVSEISAFLKYMLDEFVGLQHKTQVSSLFSQFTTLLEKQVGLKTLDLWHELLSPSVCSNVTLNNGLSLYEGLEPFVRQMYFTCVQHDAENHRGGPYCTAKPRERFQLPS